ncbi:ABC transporter ATP-binding protein [Streptomyces sp. UH6]|uniref:ABC transporter ATP-binding protein n=1 Tax=Streptomyces sp. UH6 TaxID=2748379 RepID=UPI0015D5118C|nr:ABC transporter ATP-binding protein [Streptomyces sp. UH6]NYV75952.1 ABC transporter ATP-binding protein [Streptomyces sp. UH6]
MTTTRGHTPVVAFRGAVKEYGAVRAVDGLDLEFAAGERVALLGRNGAGKSTSIALMLGLEEPTAGTVELFGGPPRERVESGRVGAMLQDFKPVSRLTVRELIGFVASAYPAPLPVADVLDLAGISHLAKRRVEKLSGGQTQRVCFAVALAGDPDLLVLDEPTAALDVQARQEFWTAMRALTDRGKTVLFSTHYLEEADRNADRIVVIDHGRLIADGGSAEIKRAVGSGRVSFDAVDGALPEGVDTLPGVVGAETADGRVRLRTTDPDATTVALVGLLLPRNLEVTQAGLEEAFLTLTSEPAASGTPAVAEKGAAR